MNEFVSKRQQMLSAVIGIVKDNVPESIPQHLIISGDCGSGKTNFLESVEKQLIRQGFSVQSFHFPYSRIRSAGEITKAIDEQDAKGKRILLIDDFDMLLDVLPAKEQYRLRAFLFEKGAPTMIGTTTGLYKGFSDYRTPFYDAFKIFHLEELEKADLTQILSKQQFSKLDEIQRWDDILKTLNCDLSYINSFFHWYFKHKLRPEECMEQIVKDNSKYFRLLFESLPNLQQQIILGLASIGGQATTVQIRQSTQLDNSTISSSLSRMEQKRLVRKSGEKKRNYSYSIKDKLFEQWIKTITGL